MVPANQPLFAQQQQLYSFISGLLASLKDTNFRSSQANTTLMTTEEYVGTNTLLH